MTQRLRPSVRLSFAHRLLGQLAAIYLLSAATAISAQPEPAITTARDVARLTREEGDQRRPVELRATVTFVGLQPTVMFVQDETRGIFVNSGTILPNCKPGDQVHIRGYTESGRFTPVVAMVSMENRGFVGLPKPENLTLSELWTGRHDCRHARLRGYVNQNSVEGAFTLLNLTDGQHRAVVWINKLPPDLLAELQFAEVEVEGPTSVAGNEGRKVTAIEVWVPSTNQLRIVRSRGEVLRTAPLVAIETLGSTNDQRTGGGPARVRGTVTLSAKFSPNRSGVTLQSGDRGLKISIADESLPRLGSAAEAIGWITRRAGDTVLVEANILTVGAGEVIVPKKLTPAEARKGEGSFQLVTMTGNLVHRISRNDQEEWIMEQDNESFEAVLPERTGKDAHRNIVAGTALQLTGVLQTSQPSAEGQMRLRLMTRSPADIKILSSPPWPSDLVLKILSATLALHVAGLGTMLFMYRRLRRRTTDLAEARTALEYVNRELEHRVQARTATLTSANEALRESEERFRQLATHIDEIFWMSTPDHSQLLYLSPSFERICGRPAKEVYDAPDQWFNLVHPDDRDEVFRTALQQPLVSVYEIEYRIIRPDGTLRWLNDRAFPIRNEQGVIFRVAGIAADITARKQNEEEMREQNLALTNAMPGIGRLTNDGHYITVNAYYAALQGCTPKDLIGTHFSATIHPEDMLRATKTFERMMADGKGEVELRGIRRDGVVYWKHVMLVRISDSGGKMTGFHCMIRDITARKRDEMLLEGQKSVLETIADGAPLTETLVSIARFVESQSPKSRAGILLATEDGKYLRNGAAPSLPADLAPLTEHLPIDANSGSCGSCAYLRHRVVVADLATDPLFGCVKDHYIAHGLLASVSVPVLGSRGEVLGTICLFFNTPRKPTADEDHLLHLATQIAAIAIERDLTQNAERLAQERYQSIVHNANDAVITFDDQHRIEVFNHAAELMFGLSAKEAIGRTISDFVPALDADTVHQRLRAPHASAGQPELAEPLAGRRHSGEEFPIDASLSQSTVRGRTLTTVILRDLTEKQRAEKTRHQLESRLRQAHKMEAIGTLAGGIAHDFNNILGAIMLNIELARGELPARHTAQEYLAALRGSSLRARDLVRQILAFSRQQEQQRHILRLDRVVEEALKLIRAALPASIEINLRLTSDGPSILADSTQVHQVLTNLSANAAHAMREHGGRLDIQQHTVDVDEQLAAASPDLQPGRYVELVVTDTGSGMPPEILERIFDPFFTTKGPGEGTGLGLAVVHGIMKDHDGAIVVESTPGKGTTFRLYFPAVEQAATRAPEDRQPVARGQGEHVLIIDDEEPLLRVNQRTLERLGYKVTACSTPTAALNTFRSNPDAFRAVITDLAMPGMTGLELSRELLRVRPGLPVILTTGYTTTLDHDNVKTLGLAGLLFKPATAAAIGEAVHEAIYEGKAT